MARFIPEVDIIVLNEVVINDNSPLKTIGAIGSKISNPISGFWCFLDYYTLGIGKTINYYGTDFEVNTSGQITGIAPIGGTGPIPGIAKSGSLLKSTKNWIKLLNSAKIHKHHVLPQAYRSRFASRGINNIDDYCIEISNAGHLKNIHGIGIWNTKWSDFIKTNPNATPSDIFHFAEGLLKQYGLESLKYIPYR